MVDMAIPGLNGPARLMVNLHDAAATSILLPGWDSAKLRLTDPQGISVDERFLNTLRLDSSKIKRSFVANLQFVRADRGRPTLILCCLNPPYSECMMKEWTN